MNQIIKKNIVESGVFVSNLNELQQMKAMSHKSKQLKILGKKH